MECTLELKELTKQYQSNVALDHFTYTFTSGIYGLLGPNGAGKSTMMNLIARNLKPTSGEILWNGKTPDALKGKYMEEIGYMPQQQFIYEHMSLLQFMYYMASLKGLAKKKAKVQIEELLQKVDLWEVRYRHLGSFSGGMKQRALIAQAFLGNAHIIILDEPTAGLDPLQRVAIRKMIQDYAKERIVIVSTHVISDIEPIAKEIIMLRKGKLLDILSLETEQREGETIEDTYIRLFQ